MSIDLKPNSLELGRSFTVLNLGALKIKLIFRAGNSFKFPSSRKPANKPHLSRLKKFYKNF
jgi:hypothetical protein